jgi:hypothetical protein
LPLFIFSYSGTGAIGAMLSLYSSSVRYIEAEKQLLGDAFPGLASSQNSRLQHFLDTITKKEQTVDDAQACLQELGKESTAFTQEQRQRMGDAVSTLMRQTATLGTNSTKQQNCPTIHDMWPEKLWDGFFATTNSWDWKMEAAATFVITVLGLRRPNDATVKNIVATIERCHGREMTPTEAYTEVHSFKTKVC